MPNIRHQLIIGAAAKKIYDALTSEQGLSAWWTPDTKARAEPGGIARFGFGPEYFKEMKIAELKPAEFVKWICITGADEWVGTTISFRLEADSKEMLLNAHPETTDQVRQQQNEEATLLIFYHDDWKEYTSMFAECN